MDSDDLGGDLNLSDCEDGQQKRGKRLVPVAKVPEVLAKLAEMKGEAFAALNAFLPDYRAYYGARNRADLGNVSDVDMPDPDVLAVGECVEHDGALFGLVAPLYDQAKVAAATLAGE